MHIFLIVFIVLLIVIGLMSIGFIIRRKEIKRGCGDQCKCADKGLRPDMKSQVCCEDEKKDKNKID